APAVGSTEMRYSGISLLRMLASVTIALCPAVPTGGLPQRMSLDCCAGAVVAAVPSRPTATAIMNARLSMTCPLEVVEPNEIAGRLPHLRPGAQCGATAPRSQDAAAPFRFRPSSVPAMHAAVLRRGGVSDRLDRVFDFDLAGPLELERALDVFALLEWLLQPHE